MTLEIESEEAARLARELAALTGESLEDAVTKAVRERLDRVRRDSGHSLADHLLAIGRDCAARLDPPLRSADVDNLLYDEDGLPLSSPKTL